MSDKSLFRRVAILIVFSWITLFVFFPNLGVVVTSFMPRDEVNLVRPEFTTGNYNSLIEPVFFEIFTRSFAYAASATVICLGLAYPFSYFLSRTRRRYRNILMVLVIIPFWTSSLIRTYALIILMKANGPINEALLACGLIEQPISILYTETAVIIGMIYTLLPFMILPLYASLDKLDIRLVEAARDLGAGPVRVFSSIVIPLTLPGIIAGCILVFLPALGLFYIPDLLGGAKTMLIGNFIKNQFLTARSWPLGAAASVVLTVIMGALLLIYYQSLKRLNGQMME